MRVLAPSQPRFWYTLCAVLGVIGLSAIAPYFLPQGLQVLLIALPPILLVVALAVRHLEVCLVALVITAVTVPIDIGTGTQTNIPFPLLAVPAMLALWALDMLRQRKLVVQRSPGTWPSLSLMGLSLVLWIASVAFWDVQVPVAPNRTWVQIGQMAIFLLSPALFLLAANCIREERWLRYITYATIGVGLLAVTNAILLYDLRMLPAYYFVGTTGFFGPWIVALAYGQLLFNHRLHAVLRLGCVLAMAGWMYWAWFHATNWLSGWVPFAVALAVITWLRSRRAALALLLVLVLLSADAKTFIVATFVDPEIRGGSSRRPQIWQGALEIGSQSPFIGLGPANYMYYYRAYDPQEAIVSHNNYVDVFNQFGIIGLALVLWFLWDVGRAGRQLWPRCPPGGFSRAYTASCLGGLVGITIGMMLGDWFLPYVYNIGLGGFRHSLYAWLFLGGLVSLHALQSQMHSAAPHGAEH